MGPGTLIDWLSWLLVLLKNAAPQNWRFNNFLRSASNQSYSSLWRLRQSIVLHLVSAVGIGTFFWLLLCEHFKRSRTLTVIYIASIITLVLQHSVHYTLILLDEFMLVVILLCIFDCSECRRQIFVTCFSLGLADDSKVFYCVWLGQWFLIEPRVSQLELVLILSPHGRFLFDRKVLMALEATDVAG